MPTCCDCRRGAATWNKPCTTGAAMTSHPPPAHQPGTPGSHLHAQAQPDAGHQPVTKCMLDLTTLAAEGCLVLHVRAGTTVPAPALTVDH
jgi:hypothetical protein